MTQKFFFLEVYGAVVLQLAYFQLWTKIEEGWQSYSVSIADSIRNGFKQSKSAFNSGSTMIKYDYLR